MTTEDQREVKRQLRAAQDKYTYFLLAAAGAAIGLAVNQTQSAAVGWSQLPLAIAVTCWGLSFFFGCRSLSWVNATLRGNAEVLKVQAGEASIYSGQETRERISENQMKGMYKALLMTGENANRFSHRQFWLLVAGAVLYLCWHVLEMWIRA